MSLSPINFNGMIQTTAEIGNIKSQEDARPEVNQANIATVFSQEEEQQSRSVHQLEEKGEEYNLGDESGGGAYSGGKKKKKKQKEDNKDIDGVVIKKSDHASFDITI